MTLNPFERHAAATLCLLLAALATTTGVSAASACGTRSPLLDELGADYRMLEDGNRSAADGPEPLERLLADRRDPRHPRAVRLAHLLEALRTAPLDGIDGERGRCRGTDATAREIVWRFDLEQLERVTRADGTTLLTAFEARHTVLVERDGPYDDDRLVGGVAVAEVIGLPPTGAWRAGADGRTLRTNRRFRRPGAVTTACALGPRPSLSIAALLGTGDTRADARCGHLVEIDTTARMAGRAIEIEQVFYVDGLRSERVLWRVGS